MNYIDIEFNGILGSSIRIFATKYPEIPAAVEKVEQIEVPGRNGKLQIRKRCFEETKIPIEFNYIGKEEMWNERWQIAKQWLSKRDTELRLGDNSGFFYRISRVQLGANERMSRRTGRFLATFVTKDGLSYYQSGNIPIDISEVNYNPGIFSQPIYKIAGEGMCTLTVNEKTMTANVSGNLTIDTERMISYREDGTLINTAVTGNYEDIYLQERKNTVTITEGFECKVIPRWRCL